MYLDPVQNEATAFAPATVANLGPGFDWLGCAVEVGVMAAAAVGGDRSLQPSLIHGAAFAHNHTRNDPVDP